MSLETEIKADENRSAGYRRLVFWCIIPFLISLQRILALEDLTWQMRLVYLAFTFTVVILGWALSHFVTLLLAKFVVPQRWKESKRSVLPGFALLLIGATLANILLLGARPLRADIHCAIAQQFNSNCYLLSPLAFDWESAGTVFRLTFLKGLYWLFANYIVALLFKFEPYGFRITHEKNTDGAVDVEHSPLIARLPYHLGNDIIAIAANQHYIEVHTEKGHTLVLYRLSDAIKEMGERGTQIHRSYWVAYDAVTDIKKESGGYKIILKKGLTFPISRPYRYILNSGKLQRMAIS